MDFFDFYGLLLTQLHKNFAWSGVRRCPYKSICP